MQKDIPHTNINACMYEDYFFSLICTIRDYLSFTKILQYMKNLLTDSNTRYPEQNFPLKIKRIKHVIVDRYGMHQENA